MSQYNPYTPPQADAASPTEEGPRDPAAVPDHVVEQLRGTRPWVVFVAVVGFIGGGFMLLCALATFALASSMKVEAWSGLFYVALAGACVLPSAYMLRYGSSIGRLLRDPRMERLGATLGAQRVYWKVVGIMCAVLIAINPIVFVVWVVVRASGAR